MCTALQMELTGTWRWIIQRVIWMLTEIRRVSRNLTISSKLPLVMVWSLRYMVSFSNFSITVFNEKILINFFFTLKGDLKNKLRESLCINNTKALVNAMNHREYRLDHDYMNHIEEDTIRYFNEPFDLRFEKLHYIFFWYCSYGSHKNRSFKDESHKGSLDSLNGEEKKDASKEDLDEDGLLERIRLHLIDNNSNKIYLTYKNNIFIFNNVIL